MDFAGSKTIDEISVFGLHDNYTVENTPTETQTFALYGLQAFNVQYWNGSTWTTIPGGNVTGNNKVWRKFTFASITTNKIRVTINQVPDSWSRVVEIQAFGTSAGGEKVQWLVPDHLGTPRIILDQTGTLANVKRHDYLPFGEELFAGIGGRTVAQGYAADGIKQQFTSKERDTETGLDYFLARYYSATQGRFTSPDELTGGPHEIYETVLPPTPLLYAEPTEPQSLNKYGYSYGNPLRYIDPDGHQTKQADALIIPTPSVTQAAANITIGVGKEAANVWIGMNNFTHAYTGWGESVEPYKPSNKIQEASMNVTADIAFFGGLITGKAQVGGVAIAEGESTAIVAAEGANAARQSQTTAEMAEALSNQIGKNSVSYRTPNSVGHIDLKGKAHFDKASGGRIPTPHVQERRLHTGPSTGVGGGRINVGRQTTRPATKQDIRTARKLVERRTQ